MKRYFTYLPMLILLIATAAMLWHGPIPQLERYHEFADHSTWAGVPHAADVLSNLGFAFVAMWGGSRLWAQRHRADVRRAWVGYQLFLGALLLTACGSTFYHLAPDNWRLIWDRLPIALACAGLLVAARAELIAGVNPLREAVVLAMFAVASVVWWYVTEQRGHGDLRPYLLLQGLPLILIPLWQAMYGAPRRDRVCFAVAIGLYVLAKAAEVHDHEVFALTGWVTGHTGKHLLATAAAFVLVSASVHRWDAAATHPFARNFCGSR